MNIVYDTLITLAPAHDPELQEGYRRYTSLLTTILTPAQLEEYAAFIQQHQEVRIFDEMTSAEFTALSPAIQEIGQAVLADQNATMENRRVAALLNQRGQHAVAPDLGP